MDEKLTLKEYENLRRYIMGTYKPTNEEEESNFKMYLLTASKEKFNEELL